MASPNPWPLRGNVPLNSPATAPKGPPGPLQYGGGGQAGYPGAGVMVTPGGAIRHYLTVADVERLAKAGVVMKFEDIVEQVIPDPAKNPPTYTDPGLTQAIVDRLQMANPDPSGYNRPRFDLACSRYQDKVYVFASYWGGDVLTDGRVKTEPCILIDDMALFPSDALMAKLIFLKEQAK